MIGVDHGQPPKNTLLRMDVAIFTLCEVQFDAPQSIINQPALERLTQTTRRHTTRQPRASAH
jgi:hypothetical protein